jgi:hypothetical protein
MAGNIDIVICISLFHGKYIKMLVNNIKEYIINVNKIYLIMPTTTLEKYSVYDPIVENIDENIFPFNKENIDNLFNCPERSGWYLQQLLKIYAPIIIKNMLDNYIIVDADLKFYKRINFFENDIMLFNTDEARWDPYIIHLKQLYSKIEIKSNKSGITNLMPMKRHIIEKLLKVVEDEHNDVFWRVFLNKVDSKHYQYSGASEYEILFHFSLTFFPSECKIRPIRFKNSEKFSYSLGLIYEACQNK